MGYDTWLEAPYQNMYDAWDRAEWVEENSEYATECCDVSLAYDTIEFTSGRSPMPVTCAKCGEHTDVYVTPPL
jgi:hypothetical protein